ncbi:MAG: hypothetical protein PHQ32_02395 [Firmicutes bacterium]|nr:hypothetical protein [Bacillota bacterium]
MNIDDNKLKIGEQEFRFIINTPKLETLEVASKKSIMNLMQEASLSSVKLMFNMFIDVDRDKQKLFEQALEEYGFGGVYKFLADQIQEQAGFLFR